MLLSSGVVWRHRTLEGFRDGVPGRRAGAAGARDRGARRGAGLARVARRGRRSSGRPATRGRSGRRFDPRGSTEALVRAAGDDPARPAVRARRGVLATGGFGARLARERGLAAAREPLERGRRARVRLARGAVASARDGRVLRPERARAAVPEERLRRRGPAVRRARARARRRGPRASPARRRGRRRTSSRQRRGCPRRRRGTSSTRGRCVERVRERTVAELVGGRADRGRGRAAGEELPFELPPSPKLVEPPFLAVRVRPAVTHTTGGLRIDDTGLASASPRGRTSAIDGGYAAARAALVHGRPRIFSGRLRQLAGRGGTRLRLAAPPSRRLPS